jgi:glycosyltransferase involved in cell wall biosynthesis
MGCSIVVTEKGDTKDYFLQKDAFYCEPDSVDSIKEAVEKAWNHKNEGNLREHILKNFTWENAAEKTKRGYQLLLLS